MWEINSKHICQLETVEKANLENIQSRLKAVGVGAQRLMITSQINTVWLIRKMNSFTKWFINNWQKQSADNMLDEVRGVTRDIL